MKSAKSVAADTPSHRRSQPARQVRTNTPRSSAAAARQSGGRDAVNGRPLGNQPIDIFPAITHFADTISALPKELVRHFTLLKEVDAKIFAPEEQLFKLVAAISDSVLPEPRANNDASSTALPASAPMSARNSPGGLAFNPPRASSAPSLDDAGVAPTSVFDPSNIPRRQLFRQTAFKIQEMLVSLEEKNHVLSTANEALQRQLARVEDVWPYLENEFSDEAKWGSNTHWAYPENRTGSKMSNAEKARRDGAAAISAAAQALAEEAAARSDARKQAVQAKKSLKNQHQDSDADDVDARQREPSKKTASKSRKTATADPNSVALGILASATNGNPPQKRRKVEKTANGGAAAAPTGGAMSTVFGNNASKPKTVSPRGTPAPDGPKKRKALPTGSGQAKKKNGLSPSITSSPVLGTFPDPKVPPTRASPAPVSSAPRPASSRARQNSIQSNNAADSAKARPASSTANKPSDSGQVTPETTIVAAAALPKPIPDTKPAKETTTLPIKTEPIKKENERPEMPSVPPPPPPATSSSASSSSTTAKKDVKADEPEKKSESTPPQPAPSTTTTTSSSSITVTTKSGRASKPSTPALATFQEAARSRPSRSAETSGAKKGGTHKKSGSVAQVALIQQAAADTDASSSMQGDDEEGDIDADEPTYCYCNSVSYGEMVACDADDCKREWFHLACVGLKVAPGSKTKWYCEDCKERLKMGSKKSGGR